MTAWLIAAAGLADGPVQFSGWELVCLALFVIVSIIVHVAAIMSLVVLVLYCAHVAAGGWWGMRRQSKPEILPLDGKTSN